uniref:Uncharacterized protein n=1 Tax=Romanomermis culicivorax TaxID=13658 RepID=A0A915IVX8_ROMCU
MPNIDGLTKRLTSYKIIIAEEDKDQAVLRANYSGFHFKRRLTALIHKRFSYGLIWDYSYT